MAKLSLGAEAPNFDLTSTEDVVLMLRDEVPRTAVLLYFFDVEADDSRRQLETLAEALPRLARHRTRVLGIAAAKPEPLKDLQREIGLPFPLLSDDRGFASQYGVETPAEGDSAPPALFLVDREQKVVWMANPLGTTEEALAEVERVAAGLPGPTSNLPASVVNRVVNWWVNAVSRRRPAGTAG